MRPSGAAVRHKHNNDKTLATTSSAAIMRTQHEGGDPRGTVAAASSSSQAAPGMSSPPVPMSPPTSHKLAVKMTSAAVPSAAGSVTEPAAPLVSPRSAKSPHSKVAPTEAPRVIEGLKARREAIINSLHTIRATLFKNNEMVGETQGIPDKSDPYDVHWLTYRPKGSSTNILTYRGEEKALDLLRCFDRDHDDKLDFSDFRGYVEHFRRTDEFGYLLDSQETWLSYMDDLFETDGQGKVTARGFLRHRQNIEKRHPLAADLHELRLDPLTTEARRFRNAGTAFDRLDVECQKASMDRLLRRSGLATHRPMGSDRPSRGLTKAVLLILAEHDSKVPIQQLQLLLGDCGESISVQRGRELMLYHNDHQRLMASLLVRFARKDLSHKHLPSEELEDVDHVYKRGFWAWLMSGRPKQETRWLERQLVWVKNRIRRKIRGTTKTCEFFWKHLINGIKRGVITSQVFLSHKQETARYEGGVKIGKCDNLSGGMLLSLRFQQLDSERSARKKTGMPASAGMGFTLDLLLRPDVEASQVMAAVASLKKVISEHLEIEIMKLPRFLSWQVFPTVSDIDSLKVIRFVIYLKSDMHVDNMLKQLQLGFSLRDLMNDLTLEVRTNLDLRSVCDEKDYVMDDKLGVRVEMKSNFCRGLVASLLREVLTCMHDVHHERRTAEDFDFSAEQQAKDRTMETNPEQKTRFLRETFKFHHPDRPAVEETIGELEASEVSDPETEALLDMDFYDTWCHRLLVLQRYLHMVKAATWDLCFGSMGEALFGTAFARALLPRWLTNHLISRPGAVGEAVKKFRTTMFHEIEKVRKVLEEHDKKVEEQARKEEEEGGGEAARKRRKHEKDKADMIKRLQALSIKATGGSAPLAGRKEDDDDEDDEANDKSRAATLRRLKKRGVKTHKAMMDCYRTLAASVTGPHSMHLTSGRYRVYLHCEGLDVWDTLIPAPRDLKIGDKGGKKGRGRNQLK